MERDIDGMQLELTRLELLLEMKENEKQLLLEAKNAERQLLEEMRTKLEEAVHAEQLANKEKTRFLARMSHEIRTPMHSILGITEAQLQKDNHSKETEEAFLRIYSSSNLLLSIINDILDFTKLEAGKMEIIHAAYDTICMILSTIQLNQVYIGDKKIDLKLDVDEKLPARLVGDELRVRQILNNILSNAFKYTSEGSVHLSFRAEDICDGRVTFVIKVEDTGQGMTQEQLDSLSVEFSRYNVEANRAIEGTGLGLNIAYHLINLMDGTVTAESTLGEGSTFTIRLPQRQCGNAVVGADIKAKPFARLSKLQPTPMPYGRVLVVDDVEANLYVAEGFLAPYEINVDMVESGAAAIEKIKSGEIYDIIFMDHMMPGMDGVEATKIIREMGYSHPIIALTANAFSEMTESYTDGDFTDYASKPLDIYQMDTFLMRYIKEASEFNEE
ncbi:MAG: ATP-binding protein [Defluviitaleaceae bacterium]|nr:ATP-binding protein [Defluviitaleaceae bacterium]